MPDTTWVTRRELHVDEHVDGLRRVTTSQRRAVLARWQLGVTQLLDRERWDREMQETLHRLGRRVTDEFGRRTADRLGIDADLDVMDGWVSARSRIAAENINTSTEKRIGEALNADVETVALILLYDQIRDVDVPRWSQGQVTTLANFAAYDTAEKGGAQYKTWQTNSGNPRSAHAALSGTTVRIGDPFPNGMRYPGDPVGDASQVANCQCSVSYSGGG